MTESVASFSSLQLQSFTENGVISRIGNTSLIRLNSALFPDISTDINICAKAEFENPGGSVKDRPAWNMIKEAILQGELHSGKTIIDASSGNTGIALAMVGASLNFDVKICIPQNASTKRIKILKAFGAEFVFTDPLEGTDGAIVEARNLVSENPEKYYYVDQYNNENNWKAHYQHTAEEIWSQSEGRISHFVAGLGTSGTFTGISKKLKEKNDSIKCISMQPNSPFHGLEGLKHMESALVPGIYQENLADDNISVSTKEAQQMTLKLARQEGILVGISSGANVVAATKVAAQFDQGEVVTILCDRGERYLSDAFWED